MRLDRAITSMFVVVFAVALAACANQELEAEVATLTEDVDGIRATQEQLQTSLDSIQLQLSRLNLPPDLSGEIANLQESATALSRQIDEVEGLTLDLGSQLEDMRSCINDYMDTIGAWSSNVNSRYTYFYC